MTKPKWLRSFKFWILLAFTAQGFANVIADEPAPIADPLRVTTPIVCLKIDGHADYEPRPEAVLTKVEKLLVYTEPLNHTIVQDKSSGKYRAHLSQSARIRRKGQQKILWEQKKLGDYKPESDRPPKTIYLSSIIALQQLTPGDYEIDITYRDLLREGAEITETIAFRIQPLPVDPDASRH